MPASASVGLPQPGAATAKTSDVATSRARLRQLADAIEGNAFLVLVFAASGVLIASFARLEIGPDSWYTLIGGRSVTHSWIPHRDTLAVVTAGRSWVDQQWLSHLALYGLWVAGGWPLAILGIVALWLAALAVGAATARVLGASERSAALVAFPCVLVAMTNAGFRSQTATYLLFSLVLMLLLIDELRPSPRVYLVFPLLVVWANEHGSVVLGAGLVALRGITLAVAELRTRAQPRGWLPKVAALVVLPWLCTMASPYGLELPGYYRRILDNPTLSRVITEWQPADIKTAPLFFGVVFAAFWLVSRQRGSVSPFAHLALLASAVGGMLALRNMVWFGLVALAVVPCALDSAWAPTAVVRRRQLNLAIAGAAVVALVAVSAATASHSRSWFEADYSNRAGDIVATTAAANPGLKVFADGRYADWLVLEHPSLAGRISFDVRYELLTSAEFERYVDFTLQKGTNWRRAARGYGLLVLDPSREGGAISYYVNRLRATPLYRSTKIAVLAVDQPAAR